MLNFDFVLENIENCNFSKSVYHTGHRTPDSAEMLQNFYLRISEIEILEHLVPGKKIMFRTET